MSRTDDAKVSVVERCDPSDVESFGDGDERCVRASEAKIRVGEDKFAHPLPVAAREGLDAQRAFDDRSVQGCLGGGPEFAIDQVPSLGDNQSCRNEGSGISLEEVPAGSMVRVGTVGGGEERPSVDDEHSVAMRDIAAEPLGKRLIGVSGSATRARRTDARESETAHANGRRFGKVLGQDPDDDLVNAHTAFDSEPRQSPGQLVGKGHGHGHGSIVEAALAYARPAPGDTRRRLVVTARAMVYVPAAAVVTAKLGGTRGST